MIIVANASNSIPTSSDESNHTVGSYLATRLVQIGCSNELNVSFAAEGYARANGAAACVVISSVGALGRRKGQRPVRKHEG